jgi:hypothetical protein
MLLKLPDEIQDAYMKHFGEPATAEVITHLKRDLIHAIYMLLLDDEFIDAYENGILIQCSDGITRRIFPRFFVYSADYPEKCFFFFISML